MSDSRLLAITRIIQEDIGKRGLCADPAGNLFTQTADDLSDACARLQKRAPTRVAIVTGFPIITPVGVRAETDGPLGAIFLARCLDALGASVVIAADELYASALALALGECGLGRRISLQPLAAGVARCNAQEYWMQFSSKAGPVSHLIAVEKAGPNHTPESVAAQAGSTAADAAAFCAEVPPAAQDCCYDARGRDVTTHTAPAHLLFEGAGGPAPHPVSIGIGDGGNEIGMGKIPWNIIRRNIRNGSLIACRTSTEYTIACGISNWGAYALGIGILLDRPGILNEILRPEFEQGLLRRMVQAGGLVDGVTGEAALSVDGLPFETFMRPVESMFDIARADAKC